MSDTNSHLRDRFAFGRNWQRYIAELSDDRIASARQSLVDMLGTQDLCGRRFLDIGCGSGLFSLAARELGASPVLSFDYDPESVACTATVRDRYRPADADWEIRRGSVLDSRFLQSLGQYDVVYSWGVLHHTGDMWQAFANVTPSVASDGYLYIAVYNDQGRKSRMWNRIKRTYNRSPRTAKLALTGLVFARLWGPTFVRDLISARPLKSWRDYDATRGMSPWRDVVDWVGGYPFEVAKPERVHDFFRSHQFELIRLKTVGGGHGCNEYVFKRS